MEKESGEGAEAAGKVPPDGLPDAVGLFGAYRGRDGGGQGSAQAQAQAQAAQAALFSFGSRYPPPTTLGVAANQAASLGLHPAASAAWWPMASHLAAKDYLTRLQASRLHFPPHPNPYSALSQLSAASLKYPQKPAKPPSRNDRSGRSSTSSSASTKEKGPSTSNPSSQPNLTDWASTYGFRKTSSPSTMYSQSLSSLASLNSLVGTPHQSKSSKPQPSQSSKPSSNKERESALLRSEVMHAQAQAGAHGTPVRRLPLPARAAVVKGKSMPPLYPFSMPGSEKDRHGGMNSLTGLPQTISSDPSRVLGGVRLPPDTEFIKYTSSLAGPKVPPGTTNRGRKKTISLDPPHVSVHPSSEGRGTPQPKRQKVEDYSSSTRSGVEVIRLPNKPDRGTPPPNLADYAEKGLNITGKSNNSEDSPLDLGSKSAVDEDALLNLSLKPTPPSTQASDALSRLTSLSSSLNASSANDRSSWPTREGRPRNLGRGVSKPKENTVASLLAQSRALGLRPALARLLLALAETDLEKLKSLLGESASTDSECPSDSCPSDSDASDTGRRSHDAMLRLPAALGWKRVTVIKGLSRNCNIKGDVTYTPPEPHAAIKITNMQELQAFLEQNPCPALSAENFNFSGRVVLGDYVQPSETGDPLLFNEVEITKRLEDARLAMVALTGPRPTPPPLDRRIELARRQQAARDARRDASARSRDQALLVKELESSEKAKIVNREREARSQQLLEHINENRTQLTIEALPMEKEKECKIPESSIMPPISLSPIPVTGPKENSPIKTLNFEHERKEDTEEYNALDKMKDFSEKAIFDLPKRNDSKPNSPSPKIQENKENDIEKLIESHSRINEFINDSDWTNLRTGKTDIKSLEEKYLDAKNEFMSHLMLMPKGEEQSSEIRKVGKDGALSISVQQKELSERERRRQHTSFIRQLDSRKRWEERERRKHQNLLDRLLAKEKKLQQRRKEAELTELSPQEDSTLSDQKPLPTLNRIPGLKLPGEAFAYLLQVYEFLHNFWQILEFKMEAIPSLNTLQQALLPDCCPDAEKDLVKLLTELLITALDDPGMPGLDRYTTLMGHAILIEDIKPENLSEYLRLYLYANATDEVNALTGLTPEPDCEGRVPDHHQNDSELQATLATTKNLSYYEHLHNNNTYKLSAALRDKPFLALNSTTKAKILSYLCDELLQNKSVLQQIDGSLEHLNQLKKERYLMDMKIRKVRLLHQRKVRAEQKGKQKALSLERMQKSTANLNRVTPHPVDEQHSKKSETPKKSETTDEPSPLKESDKEFSPIKDLNQKQIDNNKDECSKDNGMDKDSVMCLESEGTQPEEDEDKNLSSEELSRKLEKLMRHSEQQQQQLIAGSHALRATCYGQDRYWRRYWSLGHCGGIFVEGMESAQPEIIRQLDEVEEMDQLQHCKVQISGHYVPKELRYGWWRITDPEQVKEVMDALHPRGVRERELHAAFLNQLPTVNNKIYLEKGDEQNTELSISHLDRVIAQNGGYPRSDSPTDFSASAARRVDLHLLSMVEHTENVVVLGSLQEKGWRPSRLPLPEAATGAEIVARARHKLAAVEAHIERRYLKPPLVQSTAEANIGAALQAEHDNTSAPSPPNDTNEGKPDNEGMPCELEKWREAVARCQSSAQLAMLLKILDKAIAWDKSFIWTVKCQFCLRDDNSGELLLCDGCDKGYHTYCFKPPMEKITDGDWYCWECVNKARGYRVCIVCGGTGEGRTLPCALCSKAYHADCHYPPLNKNPRGKWYCTQCISRAPLEKPRRKRETRRKDNSMDCDQNTEPR